VLVSTFYFHFLFTFQCKTIFAYRHPTISHFMCEYTSIIFHEMLGYPCISTIREDLIVGTVTLVSTIRSQHPATIG